ncbi:hypothetical protein [Zooshikella harenae]|uniref:DUF2971 domain-containing protein n=1 Tax=Zooshikella harenae TaxID=2827238 RepID=A0ABS5ZJF4_9GAMM|nr:hypothetical protein [Zooshikella harenae]MBU2713928.1 hypothetical protein [Zooshikella harenae]
MSTQQSISNLNKEQEKIIFFESDGAAQYKENLKLSGWVGRDGVFYGTNENVARYVNCTHRKCSTCGHVYLKNAYCEKCWENQENEKFEQMEIVNCDSWNEDQPLCLHDGDEIFYLQDDIENYCDEEGVKPSAIKLVFAKPVYLSEIDIKDLFKSGGVFDGDLTVAELVPDNIWGMIDNLNKAIKESSPVFWVPGSKRVQLSDNDS